MFEPATEDTSLLGADTSPFTRGLAQERRASGGGGDTVWVNNKAKAFTLVHGKGRVLFVNNVPGDSGLILPHTLEDNDIALDVVEAGGIPTSLTGLERYDAVVLQNVPADAVTQPQQRMLASYVNNLGGGLVMIGGPDSFGAGGWTHSPIDRILPVDCEIPSQTVLPSGALVIVMDRSGSMAAPVGGSNKTQQELANEAAALAIQTLYPQDLVGVVAFDSDAKWIYPVHMNDDPGRVIGLVRSLTPQGGTNIYPGLQEAYESLANLRVQDAAIKHVILLTDGQSAPPPGGSYVMLVGKMMNAGITLSTIGVGDGVNSALLQHLAQMGGGRYHPITNPNHLPQVFIKEAKTIRKNLIKEIPFTPALVRTGSPIMTGIHSVPPLKGLVLTGAKNDPRVFMPMLGPEGEPLFAHWQVGLGRTAAFTSDATNRWATAWLQWSGYSDFWSRMIRYIARPSTSQTADLVSDIQGDTLHLRLDTADASGDFLQVRGGVLTPDGKTETVTLKQTGPGIYEATLPAKAAGNYIVSLMVQGDGGGTGVSPVKERHMVFGGVSKPPGPELRRFEPDYPLLHKIADITGGRWLDPANAAALQDFGLFDRTRDFTTRSIRPLWHSLIVWLLALVLLDVACRRIAWDAGAMWAWGHDKLAVVGGAMRPREVRAQATLSALKRRQVEARSEVQKGATAQMGATGGLPASAVTSKNTNAKRKFEADESFVAHDDFAQGIGAAEPDRLAGDAQRPGQDGLAGDAQRPVSSDDAGPTTSRLLAAKRRTDARMKTDP